MIEERPYKFSLHQKVLVKELGITGTIYEGGIADSGHRIYGIQLDEVAWPKNFVATEVWHCAAEGLEVVGIMKLATIEAKTLPEAWFLCIKECMDHGHVYTIDRGSREGSQRKEFDSVTVRVEYPGSRPLVPNVPEGVPPPSSMDYVEKYLPYLMTSDKSQGELYTYGEDIDYQLPELIRMYKEDGFGTNQACMSVGNKESMFLVHSQCLRVIDTRVRYGKLHFYVYFRSWDLWAGFPSNLAAIQILKEYMASELGVKDGELIAYSKGLHLYTHHWEVANMVLRR